jgi:hypothetical protein
MNAGLIGAFIFLVLGIVDVLLFHTLLYPGMVRKYEAAKMTGEQGADPAFLVNIIRFSCLVGMPVVGYFVGTIVGPDFGMNP